MSSIPKKPIKLIKRSHPFDLNQLKRDPLGYTATLTEDQVGLILEYLSDYYYNKTALVSDAIFDQVQDYLKQRNPKHPSLEKVGADPTLGSDMIDDQNFQNLIKNLPGQTITNPNHKLKVKLPYWMGSMDKIKPEQSVLTNWISKYQGPYVLSHKLDGISALIVYNLSNGSDNNKNKDKTIQMYTRGNGSEGQNISILLPYLKLPSIQSIENNINNINNTKELVIRGELIMSKAIFTTKYATKYPNARNLTSGVINSKTVKLPLLQDIEFIAYEVIEPKMAMSHQFQLLGKLGFQCAPWKILNKIDETLLSQELLEDKKKALYEIDGIIVCDNGNHPRNVSGNPKYAFAFKMMTDETAISTVEEVEWQASKDGYLKPRVRIQPVHLTGVTITYATAFNGKYVVDNGIGQGAVLKIIRSGDVIPFILEVIKPAAQADLPLLPYHWNETGVDIILDNLEDSSDVKLRRIVHFFDKIGVMNFGKGMVVKCVDSGLDTIPAIIEADKEDFLKVAGVKDKMAEKIYNNIQTAIQQLDLVTLMVASNSFGQGFGERKLKILVQEIPDLLSLIKGHQLLQSNQLVQRIRNIPGFQTKTAQAFVDHLPDFNKFLQTLPLAIQNRFTINNDSPNQSSTSKKVLIKKTVAPQAQATQAQATQARFKDLTIVFTGIRNKDYEKIIEMEGGKVTSAMSKNTKILVIKDHSFTSAKVDKAKSLGVKVMSIEEFASEYQLNYIQ